MIFYLDEVQQKIGYEFKDSELLRQCFTHKSAVDEKKGELNNERLEYLGDSVLGFIVAEYLFKSGFYSEGDMTAKKQTLVSSKPLAEAVKKLDIDKYLLKADGMIISDNIRENLYESIVAGLYLDGGINEAKKFVTKTLLVNNAKIKQTKKIVDYKSLLNEYCLKKRLGQVKYVLVKKSGKDHNPEFEMAVVIGENQIATGVGFSKKNAEQQSAEKAYNILKRKN